MLSQSGKQNRAGLLFRNAGGRTHAFYDPTGSDGRINFTIAHEIAHTFFPNSVHGARFRTVQIDQSREANELERLCDLGASELLMPEEEFLQERSKQFCLNDVPRLAEAFGSSYEATLYRLATTYEGLALAGRVTYRFRKREERAILDSRQHRLFVTGGANSVQPRRKYRRQSLHHSPSCSSDELVRWNKSFDETSCVYRAKDETQIMRAIETLPNKARSLGHLECVRAPYQEPGSDPNFPDVLFLWRKKTLSVGS